MEASGEESISSELYPKYYSNENAAESDDNNSPTEVSAHHHSENHPQPTHAIIHEGKSRKVSVNRSESQNRADYLLRMMSRPEDYRNLKVPSPVYEKRSPTGRKISLDVKPGGCGQHHRKGSRLSTLHEDVSIQSRRHSDRQRSRNNHLFVNMQLRSNSSCEQEHS